MRRQPIVLAVVLVAAILLVAAVGYVAAQAAQNDKPTTIESPIVAAVPIQSETRYATDAFGRGELRDSVTQVTKVLIVRANGEMERKSLK
jgi:hypothetical protein